MNKDLSGKSSSDAEKVMTQTSEFSGGCPVCGFDTPFDPKSPGFICPHCGALMMGD